MGPAFESVDKTQVFKKDEMQGARIVRNEVYLAYAAVTNNEMQRRRSPFSTA